MTEKIKLKDTPKGIAFDASRFFRRQTTSVSEIRGTDPKFRFARSFLDRDRRGSEMFILGSVEEGDIIELKGQESRARTNTIFFRVDEMSDESMTVTEINEGQVLKTLRDKESTPVRTPSQRSSGQEFTGVIRQKKLEDRPNDIDLIATKRLADWEIKLGNTKIDNAKLATEAAKKMRQKRRRILSSRGIKRPKAVPIVSTVAIRR